MSRSSSAAQAAAAAAAASSSSSSSTATSASASASAVAADQYEIGVATKSQTIMAALAQAFIFCTSVNYMSEHMKNEYEGMVIFVKRFEMKLDPIMLHNMNVSQRLGGVVTCVLTLRHRDAQPNDIRGICVILGTDVDKAYLKYFYVVKELQGSDTERRLLEEACRRCKDAGCTAVWHNVILDGNAPELFADQGFHVSPYSILRKIAVSELTVLHLLKGATMSASDLEKAFTYLRANGYDQSSLALVDQAVCDTTTKILSTWATGGARQRIVFMLSYGYLITYDDDHGKRFATCWIVRKL